MPANATDSNAILDAANSMAGFTQKAVLEIGDMSEIEYREVAAAKPSAGNGNVMVGGPTNKFLDTGSFNSEAANKFAKSLKTPQKGMDFELYGKVNKYRFEVQFNPDELYINGYGGEELPIQKYRTKEDLGPDNPNDNKDPNNKNKKGNDGKIHGGSTMAAPTTRIDMSFRIAFDKSNPQDAFYSDKFTLSQTNIGKGVARGVRKAKGKLCNSVQPEVEALTAVVRNGARRLIKFIWGDMAYEGVLNSVNAEYVMFNPNGEPCRAFVSLSMVLYDAEVAGANTDIWQAEYQTDFYSLKDPLASIPGLQI